MPMIVSGAVALVLVVTGGWWADSTFFNDRLPGEPMLADIADEPETQWSLDLAEPDFAEVLELGTVAAVGDSHLLVSATWEHSAYAEAVGDDAGWDEDDDNHFDDGVAAGQRYRADLAEFDNGTSATSPDVRQYWPEYNPMSYASDVTRSYLGWLHGFTSVLNDAKIRREQPQLPTYGEVYLVDTRSGELAWTLELADLGMPADALTHEGLVQVSAQGQILVVVPDIVGASRELRLHIIDPATGEPEVAASIPGDQAMFATTLDGDQRLVVHGSRYTAETDTSTGWVSVWDPSDYSEPLWTRQFTDRSFVPLGPPGFVAIGRHSPEEGSRADLLLDLRSGEEPGWGGVVDADYHSAVPYNGGAIVTDELDDGARLRRVTADGTLEWELDVASSQTVLVGDEPIIVTGQDKNRDAIPSGLMRIDPDTGKPMWSQPLDVAFSYVGVWFDDAFVVYGQEHIYLVDPVTGEQIQAVEGNGHLIGAGTRTVYLSDGASEPAWSAWSADGEQLWRKHVGHAQFPAPVPGRFILVDHQSLEIVSWG
ncbi:MAG: hypothetical protein ACK5KO_08260 [Arachnia sp.]